MAAVNANGSARHTVRVGVFIPTMCQLLDAAAVDIIGSMSYEWSVPKLISLHWVVVILFGKLMCPQYVVECPIPFLSGLVEKGCRRYGMNI